MNQTGKTVIGLTEKVIISEAGDDRQFVAKIDTGATKSSIDLNLASELKLGPLTRSRVVKSASGTRLRPMLEVEIKIKGRVIKAEFTLADRTPMKYRLLIGQNILRQGFLIDPSKK